MRCFFLLAAFKIFSIFGFLQFDYDMTTGRLLSEIPGSVVRCLSLILENSKPLLYQIFLLFLSLSFSYGTPITQMSNLL